jgi:ATP-binding protein involved in chromosome partitioning
MPAADLSSRLAALHDPLLDRPLGPAVRGVVVDGGTLRVAIELGYPVGGFESELLPRVTAALAAGGWTGPVQLELGAAILAHGVQGTLQPLPGIKNVIAIASGKGGVGKSTTAANLALALAAQGARVGLLDADIYGPSQPLMMGLAGQRPLTEDGKRLIPLVAHGVAVMSIGFLIDAEQPMVWRGPMVSQALSQLVADTRWGELDYLLVDMPPGTGDIQLTLSQRVPVSGAVIVTTPQDIALADARKGLLMFRKVSVPVLGIVENMATHVCSRCGHEEHVFGAGGGGRMAADYGVPLLGSLPLDIRIREQTDGGAPSVVAEPAGAVAAAYHRIARRMAAGLAAGAETPAFPRLTESDD